MIGKLLNSTVVAMFAFFGHWFLEGLFIGLCAMALVAMVFSSITPSVVDNESLELRTPFQIYTKDNKLIAEYGDERRIPLEYNQFPQTLIEAVISSEDDKFFSHPGIDFYGIARAIASNLSGGVRQGASTITMQVARNFFLSREQTYERKIKEIFLAFELEDKLTKEQILELYLNKIFLGYRSYGFAAASRVYYNKNIDELNLAQHAMLAGLPKAPSSNNPIRNPERAFERRNYVLGRMLELGYITQSEYDESSNQAISAQRQSLKIDYAAPYVAELVRQDLISIYGKDVYGSGIKVYTTIDSKTQSASDEALRRGLINYDRRRQSYRGIIKSVEPTTLAQESLILEELRNTEKYGDLIPAIIDSVADVIELTSINKEYNNIAWQDFKWPNQEKPVSEYLKVGDIIYIEELEDGSHRLAQIPQVSGALISLNPNNGAILALSGGFDYYQSKFNRATQAYRQAGSTIKPFIYSYALEEGYSPVSMISGEPISIKDDSVQGGYWRPRNYSGKTTGPTTLRTALKQSLNLVSVRLLQQTGIENTIDYLSRFHFEKDKLPFGLSLSLGSLSVTPLQMVSSYATFANGGFKITPNYIDYIIDEQGQYKSESPNLQKCAYCIHEKDNIRNKPIPIISSGNAFITTNMMQEVIRTGTANQAYKALQRNDIGGKTGTTNDFIDAWFIGSNPQVVTGVWVGFDQPKSLGNGETGTRAALPIWIDFMKFALADEHDSEFRVPDNVRPSFVFKNTDKIAPSLSDASYIEYFLINPIKKVSRVEVIQQETEEATFDLF